MTTLERFLSHVRKTKTCWIWTGSYMKSKTRGKRYGIWRFTGKGRLNGKVVSAHKTAYRLLVGEVPVGHELHHKCQKKGCVRPHRKHVIALTRVEHRRLEPGGSKPWRFCKYGHKFTKRTTSLRKRKGVIYKRCRLCVNAWHRQARVKRKNEASVE